MTYTTKKLGEVCDILDSKRKPVTKRARTPGPYPYYGATGVQDHVSEYLFDEDLILVGEDGARWGAGDNSAYKISGKTWVNNHAHVLRPHRNIVLDDWIIYFLNISDLSDYITGSTVKKLNQEKLRAIEIPLPPIAEQRKIVARLEKVLGKVKEAKRLRAEAESATASLLPAELHKIFSSGQYPSVTLGSIGKMISGGTPSRSRAEYWDGNIPWVMSKELNQIYIDKTHEGITDSGLKNSNAKLLPEKSLLIGMYDTAALKMSISTQKVSTNQAIIALLPNPDFIPEFIYYQLSYLRPKVLLMRSGARQNNLNATKVKSIQIKFPTLSEQKRIVARLDTLSAKGQTLRQAQSQTASALTSLEQAVLHQAFSL